MRVIRVAQIGNELMTLDECKEFIDFYDTDTATDALIEDMVKSARVELENKFNISLSEQSVKVVFDSYDIYDDLFALPFSPIDKDTVVIKRIEQDGTEKTMEINSDYYLMGNEELELKLNNYVNDTYKYVAEYTCGFGANGLESIPIAFKQYAGLQVSHWFDNRDAYSDATMSHRALMKVSEYDKSPML